LRKSDYYINSFVLRKSKKKDEFNFIGPLSGHEIANGILLLIYIVAHYAAKESKMLAQPDWVYWRAFFIFGGQP
jgi:hypothetical protein